MHEADLTIPTGTFTCLFGASGSGKSTLLNLMAGLDSATAGTITVCGTDVGALDEEGRARLRLERVGVVFQDHNLIEEFTAAENVMLTMEVRGEPTKVARTAAIDLLERVGLTGLSNRFPGQLSGGQRQRVGIARALAGERRLLLADEPTGALDSVTSRALFELLRELCVNHECTVVLATHETMSIEFGDIVYEMMDGKPIVRPGAR